MPLIEQPNAPLIALSSDFIRAKEYFEAIVASSSDMICTTDIRGRILYFSPGAEAMLGVPALRAVGRPAHEFYARGREDAAQLMRLLRESRDGRARNYEMQLKASGGRLLTVSMSVSLLKDARGRVIGTLGVAKDISERAELERRLREMTRTDDLTGLFNQRHFHDRLREEAARARRQGRRLSLILFDLNGFKRVNDRLGHLEGDRVLRRFSSILKDRMRRGVDQAFRWGGDEFVVLLPETGAAGAARVAERVAESVRKRMRREGVSASWGVAELPRKGGLTALVRRADDAMFRMKKTSGVPSRAR